MRAGPSASPPLNMHHAVIFQAVLVSAVITFIYLVEGKQTRRARDEEMGAALNRGSPDSAIRAEAGTAVEVREVRDSERPSEELPPVPEND